jgi:hypothetical protein
MPREDDEVLDGIDAPRRMPPSLRARLEAELVAAPADETDATAVLLAGIDGPRPMPQLTRMRVTQTLLVASAASRRVAPMPRRRAGQGWGAVAAIVVAVVSSFAVVPERSPQFASPAEGDGRPSADGVLSGADGTDDDLLFSSFETRRPGSRSGVGKPGFDPAPAAAPVDPPKPGVLGVVDPSPPFAFSDDPGALRDASKAAPATTAARFRISLISGDPEAEAGFRAYLALRDRAATSQTRPFEIVGPAQEADVTVNLSGTPLPSIKGVGIETLLAPDRLLQGDVFNFAGSVDRQARLLVEAAGIVGPATAVIYREPAGILYDEAPAALAEALADRGVTAALVAVHPGQRVAPLPVDAVFMSLSPFAARQVAAAYPVAPKHGLNGLGTLAESSAVTDLPPGTRFISPYTFPASQEAATIKELTRLPKGARVYHGWIVAKTLAVAVWRENPRTTDQLRGALQRMANYANGFAPAYTYRPGTNSVRPEGVLFTVGQNGASQSSDFLTAHD